MPLANGELFAGFQILRTLGVGGMGEVYLVQHPRLPRQDALKILPAGMSADAEFRARFTREAELAAALYHPHIVGVHDRGEWGGQLWISMDYIDGPDAGTLLRDRYPGGMPVGEVVEIVTAVADALDYAHDRGLLHRDIKPPNILLTRPDRGRRRVLLADFGIARGTAEVSGLTDTNVTLGTVNYAAPEQLMGTALDGRADQYGLAATAYHLLTGSPMFGASNPAVVIGRHLNAPPPRLSERRPELAALNPVLAKALSKRPADRFRTCTEFAGALRHAAQSGAVAPVPPRPAPPVPAPSAPHTAVLPRDHRYDPADVAPAARKAPRWPWLLAGAALLVAVLVAGLAVVGGGADRTPAAPTPAPTMTTRLAPTTTTRLATTSMTSTTAPTQTVGAPTFAAMRDLVGDFYAELPGNPMAAWDDLDARYQQRNGLDGYLGFWSTIASVELLSVTPATRRAWSRASAMCCGTAGWTPRTAGSA